MIVKRIINRGSVGKFEGNEWVPKPRTNGVVLRRLQDSGYILPHRLGVYFVF